MNRHCIFCGAVAEKQNDSLYLCPEGHQNWINPAVGTVAYVVKDGKVLYGIRSIEPNAGKLCLPGGFIDVGETAEQAVVREVKEELGVDAKLTHCLGTYASSYNGRAILNIVFVAEPLNDTIAPGDDMGGGDPVWRNIEELPSLDEVAFAWYGDTLEDLRNWRKQQ